MWATQAGGVTARKEQGSINELTLGQRHLQQRCGICAVTRATPASKQRINSFIFFCSFQLNMGMMTRGVVVVVY